jgi:hypothetical protein
MNSRQWSQSGCAPTTRGKGGCKPPPALPSLQSYEEIVRDYIARCRERVDEDLGFYAATRSLRKAVENAAFGKTKDLSRHSHYYRRQQVALDQFAAELLYELPNLRRAKDFDDLHEIVESVGRPIRDIGTLTIYDTAERIGARRGLEPQRVYLHCGAEKGARYLGFVGRKTLELKELPRAFRKLLPREAEDCLCIYREDIRRIAAGEQRRKAN